MRRVALYFSISILTFLTGFMTALVFDRPAAPTIDAARQNTLPKIIDLFGTRSHPKKFKFDDFDTGGSSVMVMDEKTGRMYCLQSGGRFAHSDH